jgi:hypothetical protein
LSNITNLNRDYLIKINVKEATIDVPKMTFWNTDKKTSNMFVQLVINMSENELIKNYVTIENATDYKITLNVIKPKTNQYRTFEAKLLNEEKALFEIDLTSEFIDQVGNYNFEFEVSSKVDNNDESITTSSSTYEVKGSILTNLNEEISSSPDLPILKQLIEQVKSLQGGDLTGYQKKSDTSLETTSKEIVGAINELSSQFKDIANEKIDNVTLSNNVLTFFANSKTIKTITLPTSTTGGGTNGKEIELQKSTTHIQWRYVGDTDWNNLVALTDLKGSDGAKGDKGDKGDTGTTPNLQIGTVETLDSGSNATASITGTVENPLLNLGIPKGADGESGTGTGGSSEIWKKVIETTFGEDCYAFTVTKDKDDNGLQIKEGFIFITASQPKDTSSNLSFGIGFKDWESSFNGKATIYSLSLYKNYEFYRVGFYFKVINNFVFTQYLGNNRIGVSAPIYNNFNSSSISNANMTSNFRALLNNLDYIDKITVGLDMSTTGLFSKDSIMEVWAKC